VVDDFCMNITLLQTNYDDLFDENLYKSTLTWEKGAYNRVPIWGEARELVSLSFKFVTVMASELN
jgi:hypothetical protein